MLIPDRDIAFEAFAASICVKFSAFERLSPGDTKARCRLLESISDDIKKCSNLTRPRISQKALDKCKALGIENLQDKDWHDQPKFDPGRKIFRWEHFNPVSAIREKCHAKSEQEIFEILKKGILVVWILKEEDKELTRQGRRIDRPDPEAAYRDAKIVIVSI
ncbi:MAG TPA: hypothetical protein VHD56_15715 [Tepidisphaeraceae bacterium]|nr:hypothetical protein [Tepidisphaeraceae bacterium]